MSARCRRGITFAATAGYFFWSAKMSDTSTSELFAMLGYEVDKVEEAIALRFTYGKATDDEDGPTQDTPILFLLADEARQLARDLLHLADKIDGEPAPPLQ
jgi:hypothetical protein